MNADDSNLGKWNSWYAGVTLDDIGAFRYSDTETYQMAADFLSDLDSVEDWGCGTGGFKRVCKSPYVGLDGSNTPFADKIVDLCDYRSSVDGVMMRHVLEHNYQWKKILSNAVASARKKMCLVIFTPFQADGTKELAHNKPHGVDVPDLAFKKEDIEAFFAGCSFECKSLATASGYGVEHIYFITKQVKICIISANLGNIDTCNVSRHVEQELPAGWSVALFYHDSSNTKLRQVLHPRMQAKLYKMYGWQLHPGYDYYIWLDAAFVISSKDTARWMVQSCGTNPMALFRHPWRKTIRAEAEYCLDAIRRGENYLADRYAAEPLEEQVSLYLSEPGFKDLFLFAGGAFCYRPTAAVKDMLRDWYLECCRWSCQDQLSLPVVLQRHGVAVSPLEAELFHNQYLLYEGHDASGIAQVTQSQAKVQVFPFGVSGYSEETSVGRVVRLDQWEELSFALPSGAGNGPLRIDPSDRVSLVEIQRIVVTDTSTKAIVFAARAKQDFKALQILEPALLLEGGKFFSVFSCSDDPNILLPQLPRTDVPLQIDILMRVQPVQGAVAAALQSAHAAKIAHAQQAEMQASLLRQELQRLNRMLDGEREMRISMQHSKSWAVTRPLRSFVRRLRG